MPIPWVPCLQSYKECEITWFIAIHTQDAIITYANHPCVHRNVIWNSLETSNPVVAVFVQQNCHESSKYWNNRQKIEAFCVLYVLIIHLEIDFSFVKDTIEWKMFRNHWLLSMTFDSYRSMRSLLLWLVVVLLLLPFDGRVTARRNLSIHPTNGFWWMRSKGKTEEGWCRCHNSKPTITPCRCQDRTHTVLFTCIQKLRLVFGSNRQLRSQS